MAYFLNRIVQKIKGIFYLYEIGHAERPAAYTSETQNPKGSDWDTWY